MTEKKYLENWEREAVFFIERYHACSGVLPENSDILEYVNSLKPYYDFTEEHIDNLKKDPLFKESMRVRGIYLAEDLNLKVGQLCPRQLAAASVMMNVIDRRSDEKKLRDLGISTEEWETWRLDKNFNAYLAGRAEKLIEGSQHEAHLGLLRGVRQGNIAAIKYYNELVGRYVPEQDQNVNLRLLLGRILEIIQKHVKDPEKLAAMAAEMGQVAIENQVSSQASPVARTIKGELI